jgi:F-box/leucine-rich repeat protein 13
MLVPEDKRPKRPPLPYYMLRGEFEEDQPTPEMYTLAYEYNCRRVLGPVVRSVKKTVNIPWPTFLSRNVLTRPAACPAFARCSAWVKWYRNRVMLKNRLMERLQMAKEHYK